MAISEAVKRFWPPGPYAIGAATARIVEALLMGSRQLHPATTVLDGEPGPSGVATLLPLELGRGRILRRAMPSLSPREGSYLFSTDPRV